MHFHSAIGYRNEFSAGAIETAYGRNPFSSMRNGTAPAIGRY